MITLLVGLVFLFIGMKLGARYQDFQDIMLARRVSKIINQGKQFQEDKEQYEKAVNVDLRQSKKGEISL
jgi:hypothetical protein